MTRSLSGRTLVRAGALAAATLTLASFASAYDIPTGPELDGNSAKENWISLSAGAFLKMDGSEASYQRRHQHESTGMVGVDSLRYNTTVFGDRTLRIDGKAVVGDGEYMIRAVLRDENNGWYLDAGFKESRVFYSGTGGYSPGALWHQPFDDQVWIDRGEFWLEAGLQKDAWSFKIRGSHSYRDGTKDSTMWGDTIYAGQGSGVRAIVPTPLYIDETRDSIALDLGYETEALEFGAGIRMESIETENSRVVLRNPGQANPTGNGQRYLWTTEGTDSDLFASHAFVVKPVGDRLVLSGAASMTTLDTVLSGERVYSAQPFGEYTRAFPRGGTAHGYLDLEGETQWDQWVLVGNASFVASKNWTISGGIRFENQTQDSFSDYLETFGPANNADEPLPFAQEGERDFDELLATIEANYTGLENFVITPFAEFATGEGSLIEFQEEFEDAEWHEVIDRDTEFDRDYLKYGITARWYPVRTFNAAVGAYTKERNNAYDAIADNTPPTGGNRYPAFIDDQDFTTDDVYLKATFRPISSLSVTARWDRQNNTIDTTELGLAGTVSSEQDIDILSATVSWMASSRISAQVGVNKVDDSTVTGTVSNLSPSASFVGRFRSDYTTYNAIVMIALDETADLQLDYYRFSADNDATNPAITLPYGLRADENVFGITYSKKLSADLIVSLRGVISSYDEPSAGGNMDYDAQMLYGRLQMRF